MNNKIDNLFNSIKESKEYKTYIEIANILEKDPQINQLIKEIKQLQKQSVNLEYQGDITYKQVDKTIEEKVKLLNQKPQYQEYLKRIDKLNNILSESSNNIEKYINSKI